MKQMQMGLAGMARARASSQKGFTLIELMIVVAIIGILAAVAIPQYQDYVTRAKLSNAATFVNPIKTAIAQYSQENGALPNFAAANGAAAGWTSLGLSAAPTTPTTEVTSVSMAANGVITLTLAVPVTVSGTVTAAPTVTMTPTVGATSITWGNACTPTGSANMIKVFPGCT
jgi:type IV pilus assembly protein PilA